MTYQQSQLICIEALWILTLSSLEALRQISSKMSDTSSLSLYSPSCRWSRSASGRPPWPPVPAGPPHTRWSHCACPWPAPPPPPGPCPQCRWSYGPPRYCLGPGTGSSDTSWGEEERTGATSHSSRLKKRSLIVYSCFFSKDIIFLH